MLDLIVNKNGKNKFILRVIMIIILLSLLFGLLINIWRQTTQQTNGSIVLTLKNAAIQTYNAGDKYVEYGATAGKYTNSIMIDYSNLNMKVPGTYKVTYRVKDQNNKLYEQDRTVQVYDNTPPVIDLLGANEINIALGSTYKDQGFTAKDNVDGNLTKKVTVSGNVDTSKRGKYTLAYTVSDASNNAATVKRVINVVETGHPYLELAGPGRMVLGVNSVFTDPGYTASDKKDGIITNQVKVTGKVNMAVIGDYTLVYEVTNSQNKKTTAKRTVIVRDYTKPTVSIIGSSRVRHPVGKPYTDAGAVAKDNYDGDITNKMITTGSVDVNKLGTYYINYSVKDKSGNYTIVQRTIVVVEDVKPIITIDPSKTSVTIQKGTSYDVMDGVKANDNYDGDITDKIIYKSSPAFNDQVEGTYLITYDVTDSSGNRAESVSKVIMVKDTVSLNVLVDYSKTTPVNDSVLALITANKEVKDIPGWTRVNPFVFKKTYAANADEKINIEDLSGNIVKAHIFIQNIDKTKPNGTVTYTNNDSVPAKVTASITVDKDDITISGWNRISPRVFEKAYTENTKESVVITDKYGNFNTVEVVIKNIKTTETNQLTAEVKYTPSHKTNGDVEAVITANMKIKAVSGWIYVDEYAIKKKYSSNISENVTVENFDSDKATVNIIIDNIDKSIPTGSYTRSPDLLTNTNVLVILRTDKVIQTPNGWSKINDTNFQKTYTNNITEEVLLADTLGNIGTVSVKVDNIDKIPPVLSFREPQLILEQNEVAYDLKSTVMLSDNRSTPDKIKFDITDLGGFTTAIPGLYTVTFMATDEAGNQTIATRDVKVINRTPPMIKIQGQDVTIEVFTDYNLLNGISISSNDNTISTDDIVITSNPSFNKDVVGTYLVEYQLTDIDGNTSTNTRKIHVVDTTPPVLSVDPVTVKIEKNTNYDLLSGVKAVDQYDGNITLTTDNYTSSPDFKNDVAGTYTITYAAADQAGNVAIPKTRIVQVVDNQSPVASVTLNPNVVTNQDVTVTIKTNKEILTPAGWNKADNLTYIKVYSANATEQLTITDFQSNTWTINIDVSNIDKIPPVGRVEYSSTAPLQQSVIVTILSDKPIKSISGYTKVSDIEYKKEYFANTAGIQSITLTDLAGNTSNVNVNVTNIQSPPPEGFTGIYTANQLYSIGRNASYPGNGKYILMNDIDLSLCSSTMDDKDATGSNAAALNWDPITAFSGQLDGGGFTVRGLKINRQGTANQGLFGSTTATSVIKNLKLENTDIRAGATSASLVGIALGTISNVSVTGKVQSDGNSTGGLAGSCGAAVSNCYANVSISSSGDNVGGLIGLTNGGSTTLSYASGNVSGKGNTGGLIGSLSTVYNLSKSYSEANVTGLNTNIGGLAGYAYAPDTVTIKDCYAVGNAVGGINVGGLIGNESRYYATLTVTNCYSSGTVSGSTIGGMVGAITGSGGTVTNTNCYWIADASKVFTSAAGTPLSAEQGTKSSSYNAWDFNTVWGIIETGNDRTTPYLRSLMIPDKVNASNMAYYKYGGLGTTNDPYRIYNEEDLYNVQNAKTSAFKLMNDITITKYTNWEPIIAFSGQLDGAGFTIKGLKITRTGVANQGLFGSTTATSVIKNLKLENTDIKGGATSAGLVGTALGTISNVSVSGTIQSDGNSIGGLAGNGGAVVSNCYTNVNITSSGDNIGGLIGSTNGGSVTLSYTSGSITGKNNVGGLIGYIATAYNLNKSYSEAGATGSASNIGGLVGQAYAPDTVTIKDCYAVGNAAGGTNVGGLIGNENRYYATLTVTNCYSSAGASGSATGGLVGVITGSGGTVANTNCYWVADAAKVFTSAAGSPLSAEEGTKSASYNAWDFNAVWGIIETGDERTTPYLKTLMIPGKANASLMTYYRYKGLGIINDPYQIYSEEDLYQVQNAKTSSFKIMNDIVITTHTNWDPIIAFSGQLDGNGFTIKGLKITRTGVANQGLFGSTTASSVIKNLKLENTDIKGGATSGGLVGTALGTISNVSVAGTIQSDGSNIGGIAGSCGAAISNCYANVSISSSGDSIGGLVGLTNGGSVTLSYTSGSIAGKNNVGGLIGYITTAYSLNKSYSEAHVTSSGSNIGGLVGQAYAPDTVTIKDCYAVGSAAGGTNVGGLIGNENRYYATLTVTNCYSSAVVTGTATGGLAGVITGSGGTVTNTNCYWIADAAKVFTSAAGSPLSVEQGTKSASYNNWDFNTVWGIIQTGNERTTPYLQGLIIPDKAYAFNASYHRYQGLGTMDDPYQIYNEEDLYQIQNAKTSVFKIMNDISITAHTNWDPIIAFSGQLDGGGFAIKGLKITRTSVANQGLFASTTATSVIKNLRLENIDIKAGATSGGLVGTALGTINNVSVIGKVQSDGSSIGGLAGSCGAAISNCYANVNITSSGDNIGGLVGATNGGSTSLSYASGSITGKNNVGGLIGYITTAYNLNKSYSEAGATGSGSNIGGLVGQAYAPDTVTIKDCYAVGTAAGGSNVGGLIGNENRYYATLTVTNCYSSAVVTGTTTGGLAGVITGSGGTVTNTDCYWIADESKVFTSAAGSPLSAEQGTKSASYNNWDFNTIWGIIESGGDRTIPYLKSLAIPDNVHASLMNYYKYKGLGTINDPYQIYDEDDLNRIQNAKTSALKIMNDITITKYTNWDPIIAFSGQLDGGGFTIKGLKTTRTGVANQGLFASTTATSVIKNLNLENIDIKAGAASGGLVGTALGKISNVTVTGKIQSDGSSIGGLAGSCGAAVSNCYANVSITSSGDNTGGLMGLSNGGSTSLSYSSGDISGKNNVGGLIGYIATVYSLNKSYSEANATGSASNIGGLVGQAYAPDTVTIKNCISLGDAAGGTNVGGLIGNENRYYATLTVTNCYSSGGASGSTAGGLAGVITGSGGSVTNTNCYWIADAAKVFTSAAGSPLSVEEGRKTASYNDWDFETVWDITENGDKRTTPYLKDVKKPDKVQLSNLSYHPYKGLGTTSSPYLISDEEDLYQVQNAKTSVFKVMNDITITTHANWNPILNFSGQLDGGKFKINGLKITRTGVANQGLFANTTAASVIKNVNLEDVDIKAGGTSGGLVGSGLGTITNVSVTGLIQSDGSNVGGLAGSCGAVVSDCNTDVHISLSADNIGGLIGSVNGGSVTSSYSLGKISGKNNVGGLIGNISVGYSLNQCYSECDTTGSVSNIGGAVGYVNAPSSQAITLKDGYATGKVAGGSNAGGFLGNESRNYGNVTLSNIYSIGSVAGMASGGLIGVITGSGGTVGNTNCYWNTETSKLSGSAAGTGKTTDQMTGVPYTNVFTGWNFDTIWDISPATGYPILQKK